MLHSVSLRRSLVKAKSLPKSLFLCSLLDGHKVTVRSFILGQVGDVLACCLQIRLATGGQDLGADPNEGVVLGLDDCHAPRI